MVVVDVLPAEHSQDSEQGFWGRFSWTFSSLVSCGGEQAGDMAIVLYVDVFSILQHVISVFGCDRVMFGSDWPVCLLASDSYARIHQAYYDVAARAGCSPNDLRRIFHDNAVDFYNLKLA